MSKARALWMGIVVPLLVACLLLFLVAPAGAHHKASHDKGGKGKKASGPTEDTDGNDGGTPNNVPDEGDNKHPSGKDRSVEHGKSGTQGKSGSDPDDNGKGPDRSNGGADKPGGPGGEDLADQDGNNGCGNDDDFEDDNEGWCGNKPKKEKSPKVKGGNKPEDDSHDSDGDKPTSPDVSDDETCKKSDMADDGATCDEEPGVIVSVPCVASAVMPVGETCDLSSDTTERDAEEGVLGTRVTRTASDGGADTAISDRVAGLTAERSPSLMPLTGTGALKLVVLGAILIAMGLLMLRMRRRT